MTTLKNNPSPEGRNSTPVPALPLRDDIQRILIIKWSAMGDIVIATTLMEDIRHAFPKAELHLNTLPPWDKLLFADDTRFARVLAVDLRNKKKRLANSLAWLKEVRAAKYDLVIDLQSNDRSRILMSLLWLSGARIRWLLGNHARFPYNLAPEPQPAAVHALEHQRASLQAAGIETRTPRPTVYFNKEHQAHAQTFQQQYGLTRGSYAVFMPGCQAAGWLKRWGAERYAALAQLLETSGVEKTLLIGGPDETDECEKIAELAGDTVINLCGQTQILDIVPLCQDARFIVANDTGTAHVASATDRPMVIICGPTDPRRVKPAGDNVLALQADIECKNCYRKTCSHHSCMPMITPEQVLDTLNGIQN